MMAILNNNKILSVGEDVGKLDLLNTVDEKVKNGETIKGHYTEFPQI